MSCFVLGFPAWGQQPDTMTSSTRNRDVLVTAAAGVIGAVGGYHMAPAIAGAIGLGETTKDVRPAGALLATSILIPLAFRTVTSRDLPPAAYLISGALGAAGMAVSLANNENEGLQRAIVFVIPVSQLLTTIALN